jgi:Tfp pilus assembly protein PilO
MFEVKKMIGIYEDLATFCKDSYSLDSVIKFQDDEFNEMDFF